MIFYWLPQIGVYKCHRVSVLNVFLILGELFLLGLVRVSFKIAFDLCESVSKENKLYVMMILFLKEPQINRTN